MWFSPNDEPYRGYIYTAEDPAGEWTLVSRPPHHHDASLLFDDDGKVYLFYGTGQLRQLKSDFSDVESGGIDMKIFERDADEQGLLEGSQAFKHNGKYYLLMISMDWSIPGRLRREVCYRADKITGPYEKRLFLKRSFKDMVAWDKVVSWIHRMETGTGLFSGPGRYRTCADFDALPLGRWLACVR